MAEQVRIHDAISEEIIQAAADIAAAWKEYQWPN